jgi:nicotinamide phosphoribosyltransferase
MIHEILDKLKNEGYSASNIAFGMGGYLLHKLNRDTQKFAMKCSYAEINGKGRDVFKEPVTDKGKTSKRGRINNSLLETVFLDGEIVKEYTLDQVREKAARALE